MPPKLKSLSGEDVIRIFCRFGFAFHSQQGSHVKLRRLLENNSKQTLTIPNHRELDRGTLRAIFRQAAKYVRESELFPYFYSE